MPDAPVDPIYKDCLCLKCLRAYRGAEPLYVAANLTFNEIEMLTDDTQVERIFVKVVEL